MTTRDAVGRYTEAEILLSLALLQNDVKIITAGPCFRVVDGSTDGQGMLLEIFRSYSAALDAGVALVAHERGESVEATRAVLLAPARRRGAGRGRRVA